jgi:hypothetical protein
VGLNPDLVSNSSTVVKVYFKAVYGGSTSYLTSDSETLEVKCRAASASDDAASVVDAKKKKPHC